MELLIKGGYVFDPLNKVKGEKMDIAIKDGKIVEPSEINEREAKVIDATGKLVMAGGVDLHAHIAGPKVNTGRLMRPEDHYRAFMKAVPGVVRSGTGKTTPTTTVVGYKYARMGWTTVIEPATPPILTRHTHEELNDTPILDKACFPLFDSNWFVLKYVSENRLDKLAAFVAWLLHALKGYAVKLVDPGVAELWSYGKGYALDIDDEIPPYNVTPREIIRSLCKVNEQLKLPHTIHVHCNKLGIPGNVETTLKTMGAVSDILGSRGINIHITHAQFNSFGGDTWATLESGADKVAKYVNTRKHVSIDTGQIVFGSATTMTADAPFEFALYHLTRWKWSSADAECESAAGIVPVKYKKKSYANAMQWCIALELALLVKDPWRVILTSDHPNGAPFTKYPRIISWLMSKKAREEIIAKLHRRAQSNAILPTIDREYDFYEIAVITRAAPARLLGLQKVKGHLGVGADADVAIYDIDPTTFDPSRDYEELVKAIRFAYCTIKGGEIVAYEGKVVKTTYGRTFYVKHKELSRLEELIKDDLKRCFAEWYTVQLDNYVVSEHELRNPEPIVVGE